MFYWDGGQLVKTKSVSNLFFVGEEAGGAPHTHTRIVAQSKTNLCLRLRFYFSQKVGGERRISRVEKNHSTFLHVSERAFVCV